MDVSKNQISFSVPALRPLHTFEYKAKRKQTCCELIILLLMFSFCQAFTKLLQQLCVSLKVCADNAKKKGISTLVSCWKEIDA